MIIITIPMICDQVRSITEDISVLPWYWLPATDAEAEADWKDFYTNQRFPFVLFIIIVMIIIDQTTGSVIIGTVRCPIPTPV